MKLISLNDAVIGAGFLRKIPSFLGHPWTLDEAREVLRRRIGNQATDFCSLMKAAVYGNRASPYRRLLDHAGCEYGDLETLVREDGLEGALRRLFREGVYLTVSEFKGRAPVRRGSLVFQSHPELLRNPRSASHLHAQTGGSGGASVPVLIDLGFVRERAADHLLALDAQNGLGWAHAIWGIPGNTDMVRILELCALGVRPERWFSQVDPGSPSLHPRYRWSIRAMRWSGQALGVRIPKPEYVSPGNPEAILDWLDHVRESGRIPHLITWASGAVRICLAAGRAGRDIAGASLSVGGEPITEAKMDTMRKAGVRVIPRFMAMECGYIAYGCLKPTMPDELHVVADMHAVVQAGEDGSGRGLPPDALLLSSLRPLAPFILLNVSLGDEARILGGSCGCRIEKLGWPLRIGHIRSFEKLTSGGMTFLDSDVIRVLESVLPARFGGSLLDYQLEEGEDADGNPRLSLIVSPSVGPLDSREVRDAFLDAVGAGSSAERVMSLQWRGASTLIIERKTPQFASSGKILHLLKKRR